MQKRFSILALFIRAICLTKRALNLDERRSTILLANQPCLFPGTEWVTWGLFGLPHLTVQASPRLGIGSLIACTYLQDRLSACKSLPRLGSPATPESTFSAGLGWLGAVVSLLMTILVHGW
jgi:hypothetical protein